MKLKNRLHSVLWWNTHELVIPLRYSASTRALDKKMKNTFKLNHFSFISVLVPLLIFKDKTQLNSKFKTIFNIYCIYTNIILNNSLQAGNIQNIYPEYWEVNVFVCVGVQEKTTYKATLLRNVCFIKKQHTRTTVRCPCVCELPFFTQCVWVLGECRGPQMARGDPPPAQLAPSGAPRKWN